MAALLSGALWLAGSGCSLVVATVGTASSVTATTVKTAGKVTSATVKATGRVATVALSSSGEVAALSMESASKLARAGLVVVVDGGTGAVVELPWREGMQLYGAVRAGHPGVNFRAVRILRGGRWVNSEFQALTGSRQEFALWPRDVIELRR